MGFQLVYIYIVQLLGVRLVHSFRLHEPQAFAMIVSTLGAFFSVILDSLGLFSGQAPMNGLTFDGLSHQAQDFLSNAVPVAPRFVVYSDRWVSGETGPPPVAQVKVRAAISI